MTYRDLLETIMKEENLDREIDVTNCLYDEDFEDVSFTIGASFVPNVNNDFAKVTIEIYEAL